MHILQPKITKLKTEEINKLLSDLNISLIQIPKIKISDPSIPEGVEISDILKIERTHDNKKSVYFRVVSV